jgi:hypothetical protein
VAFFVRTNWVKVAQRTYPNPDAATNTSITIGIQDMQSVSTQTVAQFMASYTDQVQNTLTLEGGGTLGLPNVSSITGQITGSVQSTFGLTAGIQVSNQQTLTATHQVTDTIALSIPGFTSQTTIIWQKIYEIYRQEVSPEGASYGYNPFFAYTPIGAPKLMVTLPTNETQEEIDRSDIEPDRPPSTQPAPPAPAPPGPPRSPKLATG